MHRSFRPTISHDAEAVILFCVLGLATSLLFLRLDADAAEFILNHLQ